VDEVTAAAHAAMQDRDWARLRLLLHPYLHWTCAGGTRLRGRTRILDMLAAGAAPVPPSEVELRDDQIYRWQEPPPER
jgi:hypothetical protein